MFRDLRLNLALALFKGGQLKESIPEFEILRKSATPTLLTRRGQPSSSAWPTMASPITRKAAPYLKEAAEAEPYNLPLLLALEHSYLWSNQYKYVLDVYRQILALNPDSAEADMLAGEALDEMKDNVGASRCFALR
jgi:tetratricopeptide (TPR) repeat protein